uniref:Uncharacterized protein n=1 Tax=Candidatus Methanogaster sp. ANME-2c ERB4 TaxID=2759911 RepID=A0A7G9YR43_9EURY|nr:hypothetical protein EGLMOMJH_00016 [Methanosarcinales archaeon ANME-2c ERB4]
MIDANDPELRGGLLKWAWIISIGMLVLGYIIMFLLITGKIELR